MSATIDILAERHDRPAVLRSVEFVCPLCGEDRSGTLGQLCPAFCIGFDDLHGERA